MTRKLNWRLLAPALVVPLLGSLVYFVWFPDGTAGKAAYTATKVFTLVYPLLFLRIIGTTGLFKPDPTKPAPPSWRTIILTGLGSGIIIAILGALLMLTPIGTMIRDSAAAVNEKADGLGFSHHYLLFALFVSIFHSALEEFYWRWFVYGQLRTKLGPKSSHLLAALAFAAHHLVVTLQFFPPPLAIFLAFCVAVGGLIWTLLYQWHRTIVGCWLSHLCVDALLMAVGYQLIS